jgi:hypothetical protein
MRHEVNRRRAATYLLTIVTATIWLVGIFLSTETTAQQALGTIIQSAKTQDKKETPISTRKPHRLIRKPQSPSAASVVPLQPTTAGPSSFATPPVALEPDITTSSKETSSESKNTGRLSSIAAPLSTVHITPSATTTTGSISAGSAPTGTIPLAAAGTGKLSTSGSGGGGGRSMNRLAAEMPGLAQLISPPSAPIPSINPAIGASPTSLSFAATAGGANPATKVLSISNTGGGTLSWTATDSATWLTLSPASGTGNGTVTLTATTGTLAAGSYSGAVTMNATGVTPVTVPVTFTVTAPVVTPTIGLSPTTFSFTATQGAANPAPKTLNVTNPGTGTLTWSVTDNASWLTLTPASGTTTTGISQVTLSVNTAGLLAGPFTAAITVTATTATNSPLSIPVTVTLSAPTTSTAALTWNANTEPDLAGYKVYQATASGAYPPTPIATLPKTILSYTAMGLQMVTTYYFTITAYDSAGNESQKSAEVSKSIF